MQSKFPQNVQQKDVFYSPQFHYGAKILMDDGQMC